jgi:hypothetical protein
LEDSFSGASFFAAIPAVLLGLLWELPVALLGGNRPFNTLTVHIALSAMAGGGVLVFIAWANYHVHPVGRLEGIPLIALVGAGGGICSALAWS